jgi:hypothetical protein
MRGREEGVRRQPRSALHVAGAEVGGEKKSDGTGQGPLLGGSGGDARGAGGCCEGAVASLKGRLACDTTRARGDVSSLARWSGDVEARTREKRRSGRRSRKLLGGLELVICFIARSDALTTARIIFRPSPLGSSPGFT